jgi:hypothetical protein
MFQAAPPFGSRLWFGKFLTLGRGTVNAATHRSITIGSPARFFDWKPL